MRAIMKISIYGGEKTNEYKIFFMESDHLQEILKDISFIQQISNSCP